MTDYLAALALLLEYIGLHPRVSDDHELTAVIREYGPGIDGCLEGEHMGYRKFICERVTR